MIAQCVLILRAREHRPRRRAPVRPHSANWNEDGRANRKSGRFAGSTTPTARAAEKIAANVTGGLNVFRRVQRFWVFHLQLKEKVGAGAKVGTWRQFVRAWCDTRARRNGACRWRVTAPRSPRARGLGNGKFFERAGCGATRRCAPRKAEAADAAEEISRRCRWRAWPPAPRRLRQSSAAAFGATPTPFQIRAGLSRRDRREILAARHRKAARWKC